MSPREGRDRAPDTTPQRLPDTQPQVFPGQHYDFTLQAVFEMQKTVGKLTEAVENLKADTKQQGEKLDAVRIDIHGAKAVVRVVGGALILFFAFLGWVIYEALPLIRAHQ